MPTYEYLCQACSHRFETWQKMTDDPLTICPECGGHIRRVLYATGVIFKGSGFYKTDYNKNGSLPPGNGDGEKTESTQSDAKTGESKSSEQSKSSDQGKSETTTNGENKAARATAS